MNKILKIIIICMILTIVWLEIKMPIIFGVGRLVDIPIPPNSSGYTDFSPEDGDKRESQYEERKENLEKTADEFVGKSGNNYLKKLEVEGYQLEPKFNKQTNEYVLDIKNESNVSEINIITEAEEPEKTVIEGNGIIKITEEQDIVNINVIAENGNLNVYTINIKNKNKQNAENNSDQEIKKKKSETVEHNAKESISWNKIVFPIICIGLLFIILIFNGNKKGKH